MLQKGITTRAPITTSGSARAPGSTSPSGSMAGSRAPGTTKTGARAGGRRAPGPGANSAGIATGSPTAPTYTVCRIFRHTANPTASGRQVGPEMADTETKKSVQKVKSDHVQ